MPDPEPPCHTSVVPPWLFRGQGFEGTSDSVSKAVGRQTKHRAVGVTNSSNGATISSPRTNPSGTRVPGDYSSHLHGELEPLDACV